MSVNENTNSPSDVWKLHLIKTSNGNANFSVRGVFSESLYKKQNVISGAGLDKALSQSIATKAGPYESTQ